MNKELFLEPEDFDIPNCEPFENELEDLPEEPEDTIICYESPEEIEGEEPELPDGEPEEEYDD